MRISIAVAVLLASSSAWAWDPFSVENDQVAEGNARLRAKNYSGALEAYGRAAKALPDELGVHLDRGLAQQHLAEQGSDPETTKRLRAGARDSLLQATDPRAPRDVRSMAWHDLGNIAFDEENWQDAIAAYRKSLRIRPGNRDTQWNLELAGRMMQQEEEEQQEQEQQQEQQQKQQPQQQRSEGESDQQRQQEPEQDRGGQQQGQPQDRTPEEQPQQGTGDQAERPEEPEPREDERRPDQAGGSEAPAQARSRQEMDSVLDALEQQEQHLERERARARGRQRSRIVERDW